MPVWHVSIARLSRSLDRVLLCSEWPPNVLRQARELQRRVLQGAGGDWEREDIGETALHLRRRLSADEINLLYKVNTSCPVFTRGAALEAVHAPTR